MAVCVYDPEKHGQWNTWVEEHYGNPRALGPAPRKLMARNGGIVSGCAEVVALPLQEGELSGGKGYGIDLAAALGIPVWNLSQEPDRAEWEKRICR